MSDEWRCSKCGFVNSSGTIKVGGGGFGGESFGQFIERARKAAQEAELNAAAGKCANCGADMSTSTAPLRYNVLLVAAGGARIQVIKLVSELTGLGLKQAKELVDKTRNVGMIVRESVSKAEAAEIQRRLEEVGATVRIYGMV